MKGESMADVTEPELPRGVALAWGITERPHRGPKRELSLENIVEAAVGIADSEGLGGVSMSRVATSLGFTTMSLYRYVTSKDDLVMLMQNSASEIPIPPDDEKQHWRDDLREWAARVAQTYRAHPWLLDIPIRGVPMAPSDLAMADWALRAMRPLPLNQPEKMSTLLLVSGYMRSVGLLERDLTRSAEADPGRSGAIRAEHAAALRELVTRERFPDLYPVVQSGVYTGEPTREVGSEIAGAGDGTGGDSDGSDGSDAEDVIFGLERILDGIQNYLEHVASDRPGPRPEPTSEEPYPQDKAVREAAKARREAEKKLREARKHELAVVAHARERERNRVEADARRAAKNKSV